MPDGVPIEVPLDYSALNQIFSPIGNPNPAPAPETLFAIGKLGYARDLAAFETATTGLASISSKLLTPLTMAQASPVLSQVLTFT